MNKFKRIVIKISGEALSAPNGFGLDNTEIKKLADQIKYLNEKSIQIGVVCGGGNFWRGRQGTEMDRTTADHMGMLATLINALALQDALEHEGVATRVQTAISVDRIAEPYILRKAIKHLENGRVVIFASGTGNPYFFFFLAAALRAAEIHADVLLCAKNIDGIYDKDPKLDKSATKFDRLSYMDVINKDLRAMDLTAISMCKENKIPILVFGKDEPNSIINAVEGKKIGTIIE